MRNGGFRGIPHRIKRSIAYVAQSANNADIVNTAGKWSLREQCQAKRTYDWPESTAIVGGGSSIAISYVGSSVKGGGSSDSPTATLTGTNAQAGNLAVLSLSFDVGSTAPNGSVSVNGWTLIAETLPDGLTYPTIHIYYKILDASDISQQTITPTINFTGTVNWQNHVIVFNIGSASTITVKNALASTSSLAISSDLLNTNVTAPCIAIAMNNARPIRGNANVLTFTGATIVQLMDVTFSSVNQGYIIYASGDTPATHTISVDDAGRQALAVAYISVS